MPPAPPVPRSLWPSADETWAAGLILHDGQDDPRYLLLRASKHDEWGFPKGHCEPGESLRRTALRECAEEAGIAMVAIDGPPQILRYPVAGVGPKAVCYWPAFTRERRPRLSEEHYDHTWAQAPRVLELLPHDNLRRLFVEQCRQGGRPCP